ncbi:hypothetical protein OG819_55360 [Streptomyces sp. NBC_01549]|uniref:hypothetical protein n=1 Tax=Streptomyces sp. NBC_01549 TaxID=2975874 RepID=UPI0022521DED|nr:hypothetical protein [Streptomyces sp. NBC_01549]MCX4598337.1 hypothetical protein [Streptomyces sp. NBC_01549]
MTMMASVAPLVGGIIEDWEREDDDLGPEPDESEHQFLRVLLPYTPHAAGTVPARLAPHGNGQLQCAVCSGWFGVTLWTCSACQKLGYRLTDSDWRAGARRRNAVMTQPQLPMRPTPHERDGQGQEPPEPVRPHPPAPH